MDGFLFNSLGTYRPNGSSGLIDKAETFRDRGVGIYIKLSKGAQTEVFYYERNAEILSASERTALCYENEPIVLRQKGLDNSGIDTLYDFYDAISRTYRQKAEISGVSVKLLHSDTASSLSVRRDERERREFCDRIHCRPRVHSAKLCGRSGNRNYVYLCRRQEPYPPDRGQRARRTRLRHALRRFLPPAKFLFEQRIYRRRCVLFLRARRFTAARRRQERTGARRL